MADLDDEFDKLMAAANKSSSEDEKTDKKKKKKKKKEKKEKKKRSREEEGDNDDDKKKKASDDKKDQFKTPQTKPGRMIEVICNDRLGNKVRVKCNENETIGNFKKLVAAQSGHNAEKIRLQKWYNVFKDHVTLADYEIHDGMSLEMHYN